MVTEVTLNHEFLMSSYLTKSETELARIGLAMVSENQADSMSDESPPAIRVLVGGLGLGYTAHAALSNPNVAHVEVVEYLPEVIDWMKQGLVPLSDEMNSESRLLISNEDVYARLTGNAASQFDLIAIDVDHSPEDVLGEQSSGFYSVPGLEATAKHLAPGGVLGVWSYAESSPLLEKMKQVFVDVRVEPVTVMNDLIHEEQTDWLFFGRAR